MLWKERATFAFAAEAIDICSRWHTDLDAQAETEALSDFIRSEHPSAASHCKFWIERATELFSWSTTPAASNDDYDRLEDALTTIHEWLASGKLKSYSQPTEGGECALVPETMWHARRETVRERFVFGRWMPLKPFSGSPQGTHYLFVEGRALDLLIANRKRSASRTLSVSDKNIVARIVLEFDALDCPVFELDSRKDKRLEYIKKGHLVRV